MIQRSSSPIIVMVNRILSRLIQLFALYVIFHGHYSPGGGFQGGALLAASIILLRMSEGTQASQSQFATRWGTPASAIGALFFIAMGMASLLAGGEFLNYSLLPWPGMTPANVRSLDILLIEVGVALTVMGALVSIFDNLAAAPQTRDPEENDDD